MIHQTCYGWNIPSLHLAIAWRPNHRAFAWGPPNLFLDFGIQPDDENSHGWRWFLDHPWKDSCP